MNARVIVHPSRDGFRWKMRKGSATIAQCPTGYSRRRDAVRAAYRALEAVLTVDHVEISSS